jgi:hypothetical protein
MWSEPEDCALVITTQTRESAFGDGRWGRRAREKLHPNHVYVIPPNKQLVIGIRNISLPPG